MAQNLILDPKRRDYVLDAAGAPIPSDRVEESVFYALAIPQNNWLYGDPNQGSKLYTLQNVKRTASVEQEISSFTMDAVNRQVVGVGKASAAAMTNVFSSRTSSQNQLAVIPSETQVSTQLDFVAV